MAESGLLELITALHEELRVASTRAREVSASQTTEWNAVGSSEQRRGSEELPSAVDGATAASDQSDRILVTPPPVRALESCPRCNKATGADLVTWRGEEMCHPCAAETSSSESSMTSKESAFEMLVRECPICLEERSEGFVTFRGYEMCRECAESLDDH
jgi:hypothetical protein